MTSSDQPASSETEFTSANEFEAGELVELDHFAKQLRAQLSGASTVDEVAGYLAEPAFQQLARHFQSLRIPAQADTCSISGSDALSESLPRQIGHYRLLRPLGRGGMGMVFAAEQEMLGVTRALKILSPRLAQLPDAITRFRAEFRASGRLSGSVHPAFVQAHDAGSADGVLYLATEIVDGVDLDRLLLHTGVLPVGVACEFIRQTALAMQRAHELGLVHRDLKPSNLMVTANGTIKVLDLGLALLTNELSSTSTPERQRDLVVGTPDFMAPEQLLRPQAVDHRCDLYGLGATLFTLLTMTSPLAGEPGASRHDKLRSLSDSPPRSLRRLRPDLPSPLLALVESLLHRDPQQRPASAEAVAKQLAGLASLVRVREFLQPLPIGQAGAPWPSPAAMKASHIASEQRRARRRLSIGLGVFIVAAGAIWAARQWNASSTTSTAALIPAESKPPAVVPPLSPQPAHRAVTTPTSAAATPKTEATTQPLTTSASSRPTLNWNLSEYQALNATVACEEPPSLEEWLVGKKIVTVKQDGSGDYRTIYEACRGRQPGEVVEVLDVGPYEENLEMAPMPRGSGLFSRVGTIIIPAQWNRRVYRGREGIEGHVLGQCPDGRLSGFNFHWNSKSQSRPLQIYGSDSFVVENCAFMLSGSTIQAGTDRPPAIWAVIGNEGQTPHLTLVIRDCVIAPNLKIQVSDTNEYGMTALVTRNLFRSQDSHWRISTRIEKQLPTYHRYLIHTNVFDCGDSAAIIESSDECVAAEARFDRNTYLSRQSRPLFEVVSFGGSKLELPFMVTRSLVLAQPETWLSSKTPLEWDGRFNLVPGQRSDLDPQSQWIARMSVETDPAQASYCRVLADSPIGQTWQRFNPGEPLGALTLHHPDRALDWFDQLRQRWVEQNHLNSQLVDRLNAIPTQ